MEKKAPIFIQREIDTYIRYVCIIAIRLATCKPLTTTFVGLWELHMHRDSLESCLYDTIEYIHRWIRVIPSVLISILLGDPQLPPLLP